MSRSDRRHQLCHRDGKMYADQSHWGWAQITACVVTEHSARSRFATGSHKIGVVNCDCQVVDDRVTSLDFNFRDLCSGTARCLKLISRSQVDRFHPIEFRRQPEWVLIGRDDLLYVTLRVLDGDRDEGLVALPPD